MKKKKRTFITIGVILILILACVAYYLGEKTHFNDEHADGNTSGNLYNNGMFCQYEDKIYFSNLADDGTLYSMNTDFSSCKQITDDKVNYINVSGRYIIYNRINNLKAKKSKSVLEFKNVGIYRIGLNGKGILRLDDTPAGMVHQYGNDIYYQHYDKQRAYTLYTVRLDEKDKKEILGDAVPCAMIDDNYIYYTGVLEDHNIYRLSRKSHAKEIVKEGNYSQIMIQGAYLYCIDIANDYSIIQMKPDGTSQNTVVSDRVATYNLSPDGKYLFYQADAGDHNDVFCVNLSTGESTKLIDGNYQNLCITKDYLFFNEFDSSSMYYVELSNPTKAKPFKPQF